MNFHDELDKLWNYALNNSPCECNKDDYWCQDISGYIYCSHCESLVLSKEDINKL